MPSPFPGMDPWRESPRYFGDLHDSLIFGLQETLQPLLPPTYFASKGIRVWLEVAERPVEPDVYVSRGSAERGGSMSGFVPVVHRESAGRQHSADAPELSI